MPMTPRTVQPAFADREDAIAKAALNDRGLTEILDLNCMPS